MVSRCRAEVLAALGGVNHLSFFVEDVVSFSAEFVTNLGCVNLQPASFLSVAILNDLNLRHHQFLLAKNQHCSVT